MLIYTSIPYDDGWQVYVDNKKVNTYALGDALLTFEAPAGTHKIELVYKAPYMKIGMIISLLSAMFMIIEHFFKDKIKRDVEKGMKARDPRMMVVGIPNVGKSSFINKLSGRAGAKTGDRPGITIAKQWIRISGGYELLDTPGILWPKFEDEFVGRNLAFTGAIRDEVYDIAEAACELCTLLAQKAPDTLCEKYKLTSVEGLMGHEILFDIGKKRGCLISGGDVDYDRAARILLDEFRACKLGKIVLETPSDVEEKEI